MRCADVAARLSPYLDAALEDTERRAIAQHVASCAICAAALARHTSLNDRVRGSLNYHRAPERLRARVLRDVDASVRRRTPERAAPRPWAWASAAAVVVILGGAWFAMSPKMRAADDAIARQAAAQHLRSLTPNRLAEVSSRDRRRVELWLGERLDFSPPVTDFAEAGFTLAGARLDTMDGRTVAALVYEHEGHVVNVFVWPSQDSQTDVSEAIASKGVHVVRATHGRLAYCLVSDLDPHTLRAFARLVAGPLNRGGSPLPGENRSR